ncbi:type II secretion system minor pseudopilin GspK [Nitrospira defluvii]|nr:type II secretion system minor pseudopilin GspK [Nitrospira defluvii]
MKNSPHKKQRRVQPSIVKGEGGFALLLSLVIIFLLVVIILETDFQVRADLRAAGNFRDDLKAFYIARSAISAGKGMIKDDTRTSNHYDDLNELWATPISDFPVGDGLISGVIVDEERKINLNYLINTNANTGTQTVIAWRKDQLIRLFGLLDITQDLVDPIIDWIDVDNTALAFGAEASAYHDCEPGYCPRNGNFETLRELKMVKGITDEIYRTISPYLTIYGSGKINVNTAEQIVLQSFNPGIDETESRRIVDNRPFEVIKGTDDQTFESEIRRIGDVYNQMFNDSIFDALSVRSDHFLLTAEGRVNNTRKIAYAVLKRNGESLYFRIE